MFPISEAVRVSTEDALLSLGGIAPNLLGFGYIVDAVDLVVNDPRRIKTFTAAVYPVVAEHNGSTSARVERNIRNVIDLIYLVSDSEALNDLVGNIAAPCKGKPTNSAFIATLALKVKRNLGIE